MHFAHCTLHIALCTVPCSGLYIMIATKIIVRCNKSKCYCALCCTAYQNVQCSAACQNAVKKIASEARQVSEVGREKNVSECPLSRRGSWTLQRPLIIMVVRLLQEFAQFCKMQVQILMNAWVHLQMCPPARIQLKKLCAGAEVDSNSNAFAGVAQWRRRWIFVYYTTCRYWGWFKLKCINENLHVCPMKTQVKKGKHLYLTLKNGNKEEMVETRGQTKSLHGKPFPTASQFQGRSRFEEGWWHPLLGLIGVKDGKCG